MPMRSREQIEAMTGAEVDAYLATDVMGWNISRIRDAYVAEDDTWRTMRSWNPSTCLDDAMQAAEKVGLGQTIQEKGWIAPYEGDFALLACGPNSWQAGWMISGVESDSLYEPWTGIAPTPALAVCRAVIAADEAEEGRA